MLPGSHLMRTTYGPGLLGSPKSTACSLVPAAFRTHLISAGEVKSTAVRSMSAAALDEVASIVPRTAKVSTRIARVMSSLRALDRTPARYGAAMSVSSECELESARCRGQVAARASGHAAHPRFRRFVRFATTGPEGRAMLPSEEEPP